MFLIGEFGFLALGVCQHYTTPTDHRSIYLSLFTLWALMAHIIFLVARNIKGKTVTTDVVD